MCIIGQNVTRLCVCVYFSVSVSIHVHTQQFKKNSKNNNDAKNFILTSLSNWHTDYPNQISMCSKLTFKYFYCHGTKACILAQKKLVSNVSI
jgi:hypothetical protein